MRRYVLTPDARKDLDGIRRYIRRDGPAAAYRVRQRIKQAIERIAEMPGLGQLREDLTDEPLRVWPVYSYLIIYRPLRRPIEILRVLHGARDIELILRTGRR